MMRETSFISSKIRFRSSVATITVALSFAVIIFSAAVSGGFRSEIHGSLRRMCGDITVSPLQRSAQITSGAEHFIEEFREIEGVEKVQPVIYSTAVVKGGEDISGVIFKGVEPSDSTAAGMSVRIPRHLARRLRLEKGSRLAAFFIREERAVPRNFTVGDIYDAIVTQDDKTVVFCDKAVLARALGLPEGRCSVIEILLGPDASQNDVDRAFEAVTDIIYTDSSEDCPPLFSSTLRSSYSALFGWLDLVDSNVLLILALMIIVAGFNMVGALLVLLFRNIRTIGLLKSMGMTSRRITRVFMRSGARTILEGMLWGNALALALCLLQQKTHLVALDPENYFVSFVPVSLDFPTVLLFNITAFVVVELLLAAPCAVIGGIDPSKTIAKGE